MSKYWRTDGFTDALQIPARGAQDDASKLELAFQGTMDNDANAPTALFRILSPPIVQAVSRITELDRIPGVGAFETREANLTAFFASLEEVGKGAVKTFEGGIYYDSRQIRVCLFAMMLVLLIEMHVFTRFLVVRDKLFQA